MDERIDQGSFFRIAALSEGVLLVAGLALGYFLRRTPLEQIDWAPLGWIWGIVAALPMFLALLLVDHFPLAPFKSLDAIFEQWLRPLFAGWSAGQLLLVSLLAGFGEEILFRGAIQTGIEQFSGSTWLAIAIASVAFGMAHPMSRLYAALATIIGVYFGILLWATDNLLVPIVAHAAYDFAALVYMIRCKPRGAPADDQQIMEIEHKVE